MAAAPWRSVVHIPSVFKLLHVAAVALVRGNIATGRVLGAPRSPPAEPCAARGCGEGVICSGRLFTLPASGLAAADAGNLAA